MIGQVGGTETVTVTSPQYAGRDGTEVLYRIYASTRETELAVVSWNTATKEGFRQVADQGVYLLLERAPSMTGGTLL